MMTDKNADGLGWLRETRRQIADECGGNPKSMGEEGLDYALNFPETGPKKRLGFMAGQIIVPDDFDRMGSTELEQIFYGDK